MASGGMDVFDVELPNVFNGIEETFNVIVRAEGSRAMEWEARHHLKTMNHWLQSQLGAPEKIDQTRYDKAQSHSLECQRALMKLFEGCDVIMTPSTCGEAPTDLTSISNSAFNRVWTLMRGPCLTLPAFAGPNGMPVGLQIVGPVGQDDRTIALAALILTLLKSS